MPLGAARFGLLGGVADLTGLKLIQSQTFSAQTDVEFTSIDETVYDTHIIVMSNIVGSTSNSLYRMQVSTDNGSTYKTSDYSIANLFMSGNTGSSTYSITKSTNTTLIHLSANTNSSGTAHHFSSVIYNYDFGNPNKYSMGTFQSVYEDNVGEQESSRGKYSRNATETVNAFKIFQNTGTMSGVITLYGLAK